MKLGVCAMLVSIVCFHMFSPLERTLFDIKSNNVLFRVFCQRRFRFDLMVLVVFDFFFVVFCVVGASVACQIWLLLALLVAC